MSMIIQTAESTRQNGEIAHLKVVGALIMPNEHLPGGATAVVGEDPHTFPAPF